MMAFCRSDQEVWNHYCCSLQPGGEAADGHLLGQHHLPAGPVLHPSYLGLGIP